MDQTLGFIQGFREESFASSALRVVPREIVVFLCVLQFFSWLCNLGANVENVSLALSLDPRSSKYCHFFGLSVDC